MLQALKILCFVFAGFYVLLIVAAQMTCSVIPSVGKQCHGSDGDVWMAPFFLAPIGVPLLIASSLMLIVAAIRR